MPSKYYDVVVIGRSLGALTAAALLARRDFTVMVVGQGKPAPDYAVEGHSLRRRSSTMLAGSSPVWAKVMRELAHTQTWHRRSVALDPILQVLVPPRRGEHGRRGPSGPTGGFRLDLASDGGRFAREIERAFPEVRRLVTELYAELARVGIAADACFEQDAMWPPGGFFERRETNRLVSTLPYARAEPHADLLGEFPRQHLYRRIVNDSVRFATDLASTLPAFAVARLHGSWARSLACLEGGDQELEDLLVERVGANGGELALAERAVRLEVKRGVVTGVVLDGDPSGVGAGHIVTDLTGEAIANLSGGEGISKRAQRDWPRITPSTGRFVVSVVVRRGGLPAPLGREALLLGNDRAAGLDARTIHLERCRGSRPDEELLVLELLLTERDLPHLRAARDVIVSRICREFPFISQHIVLVDSVHDGLPVWRYDAGIRHEVERGDVHLVARAESMERQLEVDPPGFLGIGGEPLRGPIERTLLCGASVLPGLGKEGRLLAATSAARIVTKADRRKTRMRREMWTKMEIE
ncbi:MAG: phytoene dehydrogenase [Deltaproteobacteria bacterium]|nr:phytoene dehydrogenase [Deltaproteobacteria bacterium]